jgi:hypothetical protein
VLSSWWCDSRQSLVLDQRRTNGAKLREHFLSSIKIALNYGLLANRRNLANLALVSIKTCTISSLTMRFMKLGMLQTRGTRVVL